MEEKLAKLNQISGEVKDILYAGAVLGWDRQTYMPPGGAKTRGQQLSTLQRIAHMRLTSDELGKLLDELTEAAKQIDPQSDEARLIKVTKRHYDKQTKVPAEYVAEMAKLTAASHPSWEKARAENNFGLFEPLLQEMVAMRRQYADFFKPYDHVYDPLLDDYEPGLKTADVKEIFDGLRPQQVALIKAISEKEQVNDSFIHLQYDEQKQWDFGVDVITKYGYDWNRGRLDKTTHPFTTNFGVDDVRITTRFLSNHGLSGFFSTAHECGHALYELGIDPKYDRNALGGGASLAIHESQSRMWENLVGRSYAFWEHFYPRFQELFPVQVGNVSLEHFYKAVNKIEPSLIRVEADEATYNLHIMLRLETEISLMEGSLDVKDLPEAWNMRMQDYLGVTPSNDAEGVLQDVHWAHGYIGYFPTYALGNLVSAQLWECINKDIPTLEDQIRRGEFAELLGWLRDKVHRHGSKYEPQELVQMITGSKIDPAPYVRYLQDKYTQIYGL